MAIELNWIGVISDHRTGNDANDGNDGNQALTLTHDYRAILY